MFAGRAVDEEDVKSILIKNRGELDLKYLRTWIAGFEDLPEQQGIGKRFERLLKEAAGQ